MNRRRIGRRIAATAVGALTLAGAGVLVASNAQADPITVNYSCQTPLGVQAGDVQVTVTAPATAAVGEAATVTVSSGATPFTTPLDLPAGSVTPSGTVTVSGAQTGTLDVAGQPNAEPIPAGSAVPLSPMTGSLTLTTAGQVDLAPAAVTVALNIPLGNFTISCTPTAPPPVGASIQVS
jgi:hypothetical protein